MKTILITIALLITYNLVIAQECKKSAYLDPIQIDSSEIFLIPIVTCTSTIPGMKDLQYSMPGVEWNNVAFYNSITNASFILLKDNLGKIETERNLDFLYYGRERKLEFSTTQFLVFKIKASDYNNDGVIDDDDPYYLYFTDKQGHNLQQITPNNCNIISYKIFSEQNIILAKILIDINNDKQFNFNKDTYAIYKIDLKSGKGEKILELK